MHRFAIALAVTAVIVLILIVFRLRNRGERLEDSPEFLRQLLYASHGRAMITTMAAASSPSKPWSAFGKVKDQLRSRDRVMALEELHRIVGMPKAGTRVRLLAWNMLRDLGETPDPASAQQVHGLVVEIPAQQGPEVLAVYEDGSAGRLDASGKMSEWTLDSAAGNLLAQEIEAAQKRVTQVPAVDALPPPPRTGRRITFLTFGGLRSTEVGPGAADAGELAALIERAKAIAAASAQRTSEPAH